LIGFDIETEYIKILKTGQSITIKGKCNGMLTDVQRSSCVLIKPELK
jgi:hypothetical protein